MRLFVLLLGFLTIACGESKGEKADAPEKTAEESPAKAVAEGSAYALVVATAAQLPACDVAAEGRLVYVKAEGAFKYCEAGAWVAIDLRGPKGDKGDGASAATPSTPAPATPAGGKLRKGMTKDEAKAVVGDPKAVESFTSFTVWKLKDEFCDVVCSIQFTPEGVLEKVSGVKPDFLDLSTF
jgi:hypothetical protein